MIYHVHVKGLDIEKTIEADTYIQAQFYIMKNLSETEQQRVKGFQLLTDPTDRLAMERRSCG
jgi:hypothetical protein